jgi:hypothetical protein
MAQAQQQPQQTGQKQQQQPQQRAPYNYTKHKGGTTGSASSASSANGSTSSGSQKQQQGPGIGATMKRQMPDATLHHPPIVMFAIGGIGTLAGTGTNVWQMITTYIAFWSMLNPSHSPTDLQSQPMDVVICGLIAFSFQFALIMLCFRIDSAWKKKNATVTLPKTQAVVSTAIEVVQHVNLVMVWGALGFIVDTVGDYTFISIYTASLDPASATFIIFLYAVALYALSTVAFVRSIEFLWAGFRAADAVRASRP